MSLRKFIAVVALLNALVATYLHLWKIGLAGSLACGGAGGCAYIQGSRYGWFLGVDVALIGAVGYTLVFLVATIGALTPFEDEAWPARLLQLLDVSGRAQGVQIFIGGDSAKVPLDELSMVVAPYEVDGQVVGTLGVIGPTRMAYERVIPIVDVTAKLLSSALSRE